VDRDKEQTMVAFGREPIFAGLLGCLALGTGVGCADTDRPSEYGRQRPPIDELDRRDRGLQSVDVLKASDQIIQSLLSLPELRQSDRQWTVVISHVEDNTRDRKFRGIDYNIFLERLRANIAKQGRGQIRLIENRDRFYDVRSRELESEREGGRDEFGQGEGRSGAAAPAPQAVSPDFGLYLTANDLPNRGTTYYLLNFVVTNLKTREQVYVDDYEVRVSRDRP
jgi:hypothetical protein